MKIYFIVNISLTEDQICSFTATSGDGVLILCLEKLKNDFENTEGLECILKILKFL